MKEKIKREKINKSEDEKKKIINHSLNLYKLVVLKQMKLINESEYEIIKRKI